MLETNDGLDMSSVKILGLLEVDDGYDKSGVIILSEKFVKQIESVVKMFRTGETQGSAEET